MAEKNGRNPVKVTEVGIAAAKANWSGLIARAEAGERIILTNNGRKVAEIGPVRTHKITLAELTRRRNQLAYNGPDANVLIDEIRGVR